MLKSEVFDCAEEIMCLFDNRESLDVASIEQLSYENTIRTKAIRLLLDYKFVGSHVPTKRYPRSNNPQEGYVDIGLHNEQFFFLLGRGISALERSKRDGKIRRRFLYRYFK